MDYAALKTELTNDPQSLGFAAMITAKNDVGLAAALNLVRAGAAYEVFRGVIPSYEIINATDPTEWVALTAAEKQRYQTITGAGQVDTNSTNARAAFLAMFSAGSGPITRAALIVLAKRQASRAEILFGVGTVVTASDAENARKGNT